MYNILKSIAGIGEFTMFITPLTFTIGLINSIKKSDKEAKPYKFMAVISAYLIFVPLIFN
ncbi:hypothetical protein ACQPVP_02805 [Clostridium nigeriense]|uniref:hypothetical protein n=1 Tax=Clostridium nigeriense TaxID=1805470 RepID=UPI003D32564A